MSAPAGLRVRPSDVVKFVEDFFGGKAHFESEPEPMSDLHGGHAPYCGIVVEMAEAIPSRLLILSPDERAKLLSTLAALRWFIDKWRTTPSTPFKALPGASESPMKTVWRLMKKCPDDAPDEKHQILDYVAPNELRESIELDLSTAHSALANDEYKAATVVAGAAAEALLLWALQDSRVFPRITLTSAAPAAPADLEKIQWGLAKYIEVGVEVGLVDATTQKALELAKDYRNLIHPGRSKRLGAACNAGTAHGAISALHLLIERLRTQMV